LAGVAARAGSFARRRSAVAAGDLSGRQRRWVSGQAEGRTAEARASIDRAVALINASGSKTYTGGIAVFRVAAAIALAAGDAPAALSHIERGATFAQGDALDRNASADLGELLLLRARVLSALGRQSDARHDVAAALVHLRATLPPDAPQLREAQAFDVR
jgi:hypothetical protein